MFDDQGMRHGYILHEGQKIQIQLNVRGLKNRGALLRVLNADVSQFQVGKGEKPYLYMFDDDVISQGSCDKISNDNLHVLLVKRREIHETHNANDHDQKEDWNQTLALGRHVFIPGLDGHKSWGLPAGVPLRAVWRMHVYLGVFLTV